MSEYDLFLQAMEFSTAGERAEFLARACGGDTALRRRVDELLDAHDRPGPFLDVPVLRQMEEQAAVHSSATASTHIGTPPPASPPGIDLSFLQRSERSGSLGRLQHYEVREVLGRGGCGVVLKAFDERLHRIVAIKVMSLALAATSPARKRFLREARATAAIRHENVVNIYAVEEDPLPFLVMEYVDGPTLQRRLDESGPLDPREILSTGLQIARGLEAAHQKDLIHRDIKPANILIERGSGRVKITDFGLARSVDDASLTQSGAVAGTPLYMSPEQAQGRAVDMRSDLFSFGSVLYVMCTGRPPFRAATALAVMKRVVEESPRPIQEIIPEAPAPLVDLITRLLAKEPAERIASAKEVRVTLARQIQDSRPSDAAPAAPRSGGSSEPATEERSPGRGRTIAVIAAAGILLLTLALFNPFRRSPPPEPASVPVAAVAASPTPAAVTPNELETPEAAPPVAAASPDPLIGRWRVRGGPELRFLFVTDFRADGTTETIVPPETVAEMRRRKLPTPAARDEGRWVRDGGNEYRVTHGNGITARFTVNGDRFLGVSATGDATVALREAPSGSEGTSSSASASLPNPILGKWVVRSGADLGLILHIEYRADGTALTTFPPATLAELRKRKMPLPPENPDRGLWVQDSEGEYRLAFAKGRTIRFAIDGNALEGKNPAGDRVTGLRQVTGDDARSAE